MKTEVYSWRVDAELKTSLELEARRRNLSLSAILNLAAKAWLETRGADDDAGGQQLLKQAAAECFGAFASGNRRRAETARQTIRQRLRRKHAS